MAADLTGQGGRGEGVAGRRCAVRYALLTAALFVPLLWAFVSIRNMYPVAASTMMMGAGGLAPSRTYYVLRGETLSGETVELPYLPLGDPLHQRAPGLISATVKNDSLRLLRWPHPANRALVERYGGADKLPDAVRLPELLRALGEIHNSRAGEGSGLRLRAVLLEEYRWEGGRYEDYDKLIRSWREEL